jgi:type II secretory pathway component PulF
MPSFDYKALSPDGRLSRGSVDALNREDALRVLRERGVVVQHIESAASAGGARGLSFGAPTLNHQIDFLKMLARLTSARLPLLETIRILEREAPHPQLRQAASKLSKQLEAGSKLSDAWVSSLPELPRFVHHLVATGERAGTLGEVLTDAVEQLEFRRSVETEIRQALAYPLFIVAFGALVCFFIMGFVVPQFSELALRQNAELPAVSQFIFDVSTLIASNRVLAFICLAGGLASPFILWRVEPVRASLISMSDQIGPVRSLVQQFDLARWAGVVQLSLAHGIPLVDTLELGRESVSSPALSQGLKSVERGIRGGTSLHKALADHMPLSSADLGITRAGEASGDLSSSFEHMRTEYQNAARARVKMLTTFFEPASLLVIALFVGTIVVSLVLAMTSVYEFNAG